MDYVNSSASFRKVFALDDLFVEASSSSGSLVFIAPYGLLQDSLFRWEEEAESEVDYRR